MKTSYFLSAYSFQSISVILVEVNTTVGNLVLEIVFQGENLNNSLNEASGEVLRDC